MFRWCQSLLILLVLFLSPRHTESSQFTDKSHLQEHFQRDYQEVNLLPFYCKGWSIHEKIFGELFKNHQFKTVVEVGVFHGKWTLFISDKISEDGIIYAVDHWQGSSEHKVPGSPDLALLPTLHQQFLSNVIYQNATDKIVPVKMDSLSAAKTFHQLGIQADLIYIDASHEYENVIKDLQAWFPILNKGGLLCGDDWHWGGVRQAVIEFGNSKGLKIYDEGNFWRYEILQD
jgi:Methyltransferase domain